LVGIHNSRRGNRDNVRRNTLRVISPEIPIMRRKPTLSISSVEGHGQGVGGSSRRAKRETESHHRLSSGNVELELDLHLPENDTGERQHFVFYQDDGGLRATDERNRDIDKIYYLGVIDILTPYTTLKKMEHVWKGMSADRRKISPVPPREYAERFFAFVKAVMRGGEGGERFKAE